MQGKAFIRPICLLSCREKKDCEVQALEGSKAYEERHLRPMEAENDRLRREIDEMKKT